MSAREHRLGRNEALLRSVNERIEEVGEAYTLHDEPLDFVCECASLACTGRVRLRRAEYERARQEPTWFIVIEGHERSDIEQVVDRVGDYLIVEKIQPDAAEAAREEA